MLRKVLNVPARGHGCIKLSYEVSQNIVIVFYRSDEMRTFARRPLPQVKYETGEMSVNASSKQMDANVGAYDVAGLRRT